MPVLFGVAGTSDISQIVARLVTVLLNCPQRAKNGRGDHPLAARGSRAQVSKIARRKRYLGTTHGKPVVNVNYGFNPNDRLKVHAGGSHAIGGGTSFGAGLTFKFRRDVRLRQR
ncbi:uncharacterized protein [Penaeus vannamei]|uniref:uncharacterized protein n=1 Tax=Penaeus vannamei TaxID=6689 RepID=UPI00387F74FE